MDLTQDNKAMDQAFAKLEAGGYWDKIKARRGSAPVFASANRGGNGFWDAVERKPMFSGLTAGLSEDAEEQALSLARQYLEDGVSRFDAVNALMMDGLSRGQAEDIVEYAYSDVSSAGSISGLRSASRRSIMSMAGAGVAPVFYHKDLIQNLVSVFPDELRVAGLSGEWVFSWDASSGKTPLVSNTSTVKVGAREFEVKFAQTANFELQVFVDGSLSVSFDSESRPAVEKYLKLYRDMGVAK